jgi:hypothetical protein
MPCGQFDANAQESRLVRLERLMRRPRVYWSAVG